MPKGRKINTITDGFTMLQRGSKTGLAVAGYDYTFFDTELINPAVPVFRFFTMPYGQGGKTISDTNMKSPAQMPQGKKFTCRALKVGFIPHNIKTGTGLLDIITFYSNTVLKFLVDGKEDIGTWTLSELAGFNFPIAADINGDPETDFNTTLRDNVKDHFFFNIPIELPAQQIFEIEATHVGSIGQGLTNDKLRIMLSGYMENLQ